MRNLENRFLIIFSTIASVFFLYLDCYAQDAPQILNVESNLLKIERHMHGIEKNTNRKMDALCPNTSDIKCLQKNGKVLAKMYDNAYEESIKSSNKCYDISKSLAEIKMKEDTRRKLSYAISVFALEYSYSGNVFSFAQEAFECLHSGDVQGFKKNIELSSSEIAKAKKSHTDALELLSRLNANLGLEPVQK